jgi:hypothetical protein
MLAVRMSTVRLLVFVLGLAVVAFAVKYALTSTTNSEPASISEPKRQLDNVRAKAKEFEQDQQRSADRAEVER